MSVFEQPRCRIVKDSSKRPELHPGLRTHTEVEDGISLRFLSFSPPTTHSSERPGLRANYVRPRNSRLAGRITHTARGREDARDRPRAGRARAGAPHGARALHGRAPLGHRRGAFCCVALPLNGTRLAYSLAHLTIIRTLNMLRIVALLFLEQCLH